MDGNEINIEFKSAVTGPTMRSAWAGMLPLSSFEGTVSDLGLFTEYGLRNI